MHRRTFLNVLTACARYALWCCASGLSVATPTTAAAQYRDKSGKDIGRMRVEQLRRERGIKAAAEEVGEYRGAARLDKDVLAMDLATIAHRSDVVMRGTLLSSVSSVSEDGTWVFTDYRFKVSEVFKGAKRPEEVVVLRLPIGRVEFGPNAVANVVGDDSFGGFRQGNDYILYLRASTGEQASLSLFELTWGTQGAFELRQTGSVRPLGSPTALVSQRYANSSSGMLVAETKAAAATAAAVRR